jgi:hypothetical protein
MYGGRLLKLWYRDFLNMRRTTSLLLSFSSVDDAIRQEYVESRQEWLGARRVIEQGREDRR